MPADPDKQEFQLPPEHALERIVSVQEAARLMSVSEDTVLRHYRDKLLQLSPNRYGMRLRDALMKP